MKALVYGKPNCPFCERAKDLLSEKEISYEYVDVSQDQESLTYIKSLGCRTVPQIFVQEGTEDEFHLGGWEDLVGFLSDK